MDQCGTTQVALQTFYPYITYRKSNTDGTGLSVHKAEGSCCAFKSSKKGLFSSDVNCDIILINTVDSIKNKYTIREYSDACKAWSMQDVIG